MTAIVRIYKMKDVDMLLTSSVIIESAIKNKAFLTAKRTTWTDPFFPNLKAKIETAMQTHLGVDSAKGLRLSTDIVVNIQKHALADLSEFKIQLLEDFKNDKPKRDELLNQLGFTTYHKASQTGDQEAMISLLFRFKLNMTDDVKAEITAKGTAAGLIDRIIDYAIALKDANITQENFKGTRKEITAAAIREFNDIYNEVISVCKISYHFYKDQPEMQELFSFKKVRKALNNTDK